MNTEQDNAQNSDSDSSEYYLNETNVDPEADENRQITLLQPELSVNKALLATLTQRVTPRLDEANTQRASGSRTQERIDTLLLHDFPYPLFFHPNIISLSFFNLTNHLFPLFHILDTYSLLLKDNSISVHPHLTLILDKPQLSIHVSFLLNIFLFFFLSNSNHYVALSFTTQCSSS